MRYGIKSTVETDLVFFKPKTLEIDKYTFEFEINEKNIVVSVTISSKLENYSEFIPTIEVKEGITNINLNTPSKLHEELIAMLRYIESIGSFWLGINRIDTEEYEIIWIPESKREKEILKVNNFAISKKYDDSKTLFNEQIFFQIVRAQSEFRYLIIPMAFYREGKNEFKRKKYISAFYNFYFFLEDLFANGKWRTKDVINEFMGNQNLQNAITNVITDYKTKFQMKYNDLKVFLDERQLQFNNIGITKLIVKIRGNLHHYSQKSTITKGDPFNHKEFEPMAFLLMSICIYAFIELTTKKI